MADKKTSTSGRVRLMFPPKKINHPDLLRGNGFMCKKDKLFFCVCLCVCILYGIVPKINMEQTFKGIQPVMSHIVIYITGNASTIQKYTGVHCA